MSRYEIRCSELSFLIMKFKADNYVDALAAAYADIIYPITDPRVR